MAVAGAAWRLLLMPARTWSLSPRPSAIRRISSARTPVAIGPSDELSALVTRDDARTVVLASLPSWHTFKISRALHAFELWGPHATFPMTIVSPHGSHIFNGAELKALLLDHGAYREVVLNDDPLLIPTKFGVRVAIKPGTSSGTLGNFAGAAGHYDDLLRACASHGLPTDTRIVTPMGHADIAEMLNESIATFDLTQELEWTVEAFARYLPPQIAWSNRFGETFTFDQCADQLLALPLGSGACLGTHVVYALVALVRVDEQISILAPRTKQAICTRLSEVANHLTHNQLPSGAWSKAWTTNVHPNYTGSRWDELTSTGHHLEWIAIAPSAFRPPKESIKRAVGFVVSATKELSSREETDYYLPLTHGARALCLMKQVTPYSLLE
jgi:hypothetical protein